MSEELIIFVNKKLKERNLSHREVARRSGYSNTLISDALKGARPITFDFCLAIAKALNEPLWHILQLAGFLTEVPLGLMEDGETKTLIDKYSSLPSEGKLEFKNFLDWLILKYKK